MNYGVANKTGQPGYETAKSIVQEAWENGLREFDTAQAYGQSEKILGQIIKDLNITDEARIITKLSPDTDQLDVSALNKAVKISMDNLGVESIYGMMLHREDMLDFWGKGLGKNLMEIVDSGRVKHIGVSVYSPGKAIQALNTKSISMVQLPTNILDRRFERAGVFDFAKKAGKTIYIRSIFLQGLLLLGKKELTPNILMASPVLETMNKLCDELLLSQREIAIGYIKKATQTAKIVFGAEKPGQVKENIQSFMKNYDESLVDKVRDNFTDIDPKILNPSLWQRDNANVK